MAPRCSAICCMYDCTFIRGTYLSPDQNARKSLGAPPVKDVELKTGIGGEQRGNLVQPLGQRRRRKQRIFTLPQLVVIHVQAESAQVNGNRVGERGGRIVGAGLFVGASGAAPPRLLGELQGAAR